jgi:hypothetical protein
MSYKVVRRGGTAVKFTFKCVGLGAVTSTLLPGKVNRVRYKYHRD